MDQRDEKTWVVLELSHAGELKAADGTLANALLKEFRFPPGHPIFVPSIIQPGSGRRGPTVFQFMEGYAFVGSGLPDFQYFAVEGRNLVKKVLSTSSSSGLRTLSTIPDSKIQSLVSGFREMVYSDVHIGDSVCIINGPYSNLDGDVICFLEDGRLSIRVQLRSMDIITTVTRNMLGLPAEMTSGRDGLR